MNERENYNMPSIKNGDAIEYSTSVPLDQYNIIPDGFDLDKIYIVKIPVKVQAKVKGTKPVGIVHDTYSPTSIFDYGEHIPIGHHVIQALRNVKNGNLTFRLLTGIRSVYGRIVFTAPGHSYTKHVRGRERFEAYKKATEIINGTSPGPHRLESKVENETSILYTFRKLDGTIRRIEYIREIPTK